MYRVIRQIETASFRVMGPSVPGNPDLSLWTVSGDLVVCVVFKKRVHCVDHCQSDSRPNDSKWVVRVGTRTKCVVPSWHRGERQSRTVCCSWTGSWRQRRRPPPSKELPMPPRHKSRPKIRPIPSRRHRHKKRRARRQIKCRAVPKTCT